MSIYKQIFPTRWPVLEFHFQFWKLLIFTALMRESLESLAYEYIVLLIHWGGKEIYRFRLYDTQLRQLDRIEGILSEPQPYAIKKLYEMRRIVNEEIKKLKALRKPNDQKIN